ncbi:CPBP family intramembrane glutamic endopeptidase [Streptococcus oricebi]|uniref:CAAX prenyl protease 2/Lysostaphin resistance protein A-like domain-containing protein n=1 Tax=Streptococcus oricebi TaxID=1547447 RepID=A0ABS5B4T1_9STRE|nr:CPBP family intramembrane glutamic endopeptidase [Streptococcus oricebi]MBP2623819.1 hypothetical protein [Streptococcus oricebi]
MQKQAKQTFDTTSMLRFLFWTFALTWTAWGLASLIKNNILNNFLQILGVYGPTIGAYLATRPSRQEWLAQFKTKKKDWLYLLGACILAFCSFLLASGNRLDGSSLFIFPLGLLVQILINGEEIGWRGYMQPRFIKHLGFLKGLGLTVIIWIVWHLPLWFFHLRSDSFWFLFLSCPALALCTAGIYKKTQSSLIFMIFHGFHNQVYYFFGVKINLLGELIYYTSLAAYGLYLYYGGKAD